MLMRTIPLDISHVAKFICDRGGKILLSSIVGILSPSIPIKEQCVFVCLFVCFLSATRHLSTLRRCLRVREQEPSRAAPRARGQACTARARARMLYNFSTKKSYADAFQKQNRTRAHAVVYVTAEIFKKGKRKPTCHFPSSVYSLPSLGVFTFRIVLNAPDSISFVTSHSHISF